MKKIKKIILILKNFNKQLIKMNSIDNNCFFLKKEKMNK